MYYFDTVPLFTITCFNWSTLTNAGRMIILSFVEVVEPEALSTWSIAEPICIYPFLEYVYCSSIPEGREIVDVVYEKPNKQSITMKLSLLLNNPDVL